MTKNSIRRGLVALAIVAASALGITTLQAQVAVADAQAFLGSWTLVVQVDMDVTLGLDIVDRDGQVAATVTAPDGADTEVPNVSKSDEALVLRYDVEADGQSLPVLLSLRPDGDALEGDVNIADGMFTAPARATKQ